MTCNASGGEMVNTSGQFAMANLDQLGGNQAPWPGQNFIVQMQATINSQGAFGIDFQSDAGGYFAYLVVPPDNYWAFNYYTSQGTFAGTLISGPLPSSISTQLTVDVRVEVTAYSFYINGVDTTGFAVTGSQYINKIAGLAVDARADITFANFAIYALS